MWVPSECAGSIWTVDGTSASPAGRPLGRQLGQFGAVSAENSRDVRGSLFHQYESKHAAAVRAAVLARICNSTFANNRTFEAAESGDFLLGRQAAQPWCRKASIGSSWLALRAG